MNFLLRDTQRVPGPQTPALRCRAIATPFSILEQADRVAKALTCGLPEPACPNSSPVCPCCNGPACCTIRLLCCTIRLLCYTIRLLCYTIRLLCCTIRLPACTIRLLCCTIRLLCCTIRLPCCTIRLLCCTIRLLCCTIRRSSWAIGGVPPCRAARSHCIALDLWRGTPLTNRTASLRFRPYRNPILPGS
jgi:hypothetical protein